MSTRSAIGFVADTKEVIAVYCHHDGYPIGVGLTLSLYYNSLKDARDIVALGSLSSLNRNLNPIGEHSFDNPESDVTVAYHRDRDEDLHIEIFDNETEFIANGPEIFDAEYLYLFKDNKWNCYDVYAEEYVDLYKENNNE